MKMVETVVKIEIGTRVLQRMEMMEVRDTCRLARDQRPVLCPGPWGQNRWVIGTPLERIYDGVEESLGPLRVISTQRCMVGKTEIVGFISLVWGITVTVEAIQVGRRSCPTQSLEVIEMRMMERIGRAIRRSSHPLRRIEVDSRRRLCGMADARTMQ
jgi:hypothetical protein